ncbi:MAG TPA: hypothetical protein VGL95_14710 [Acetobacteraceae bacterium]|jgi:hypothetical protein
MAPLPSLAAQLRAIAGMPTPAAIASLPVIAIQVARLELALDEIAAEAAEQAIIDETQAAMRARARRATRRRGRLTLVE